MEDGEKLGTPLKIASLGTIKNTGRDTKSRGDYEPRHPFHSVHTGVLA